MKKIIIGICMVFFVFSLDVKGQQMTQYSQWMFNQFAINPSLAGVKNCLDIRTAVRAQWAGFEGAPVSGLITMNTPLPVSSKKNKKYNALYHGLGAKLEADVYGPFDNLALSLAYALHFPLGKRGGHRLSFGAELGFHQMNFDYNRATTIDPDPAVNQSVHRFMFPTLGFGVWYNSEHYYGGISLNQLIRNKWKGIGFASRFGLHTSIQFGGKYTFEKGTSILPGILLRIPPSGQPSIDLNVMLDFKNSFMFGLGYRNRDALIALFKVNIKKFSIGYSFDFITSAIRGGNFHTHELSLQYNGCRREAATGTACPLFE